MQAVFGLLKVEPMKPLRNRKVRSANVWVAMLAWLAVFAAPCGMASVPITEGPAQTTIEIEKTPHEHCMSLPMGADEVEPESGKCCEATLAIKPSELKVPSVDLLFVVVSALAFASIPGAGALPIHSPDFEPPDTPVPVYLSTLRLRI